MRAMRHLLMALSVFCAGAVLADETRLFYDKEGRALEATFIKLERGTVYLRVIATDQLVSVPVARLSEEDQAIVKTLAPAANANALTSLATNAPAALAAAKIDHLVAKGLAKHGVKANPLMSDEQFVRRVYLDIAGRIPNYHETTAFLKKAGSDRTARAKLVDDLLASDGYVSSMYNYFAEMLRVKDRMNGGGGNLVRGLPYIKWIKDQIRMNAPWDKMVYAMLSADGKIWNNGATGYLLRDAGMPLDNLANTLSVFLGTDVACAQCHDHPFADWTQRQFYEMAAFFGSTTTRLNGRDYDRKKLIAEVGSIMESSGINLMENRDYMQQVNNLIMANSLVVQDLPENRTKLPPDYRYKDGNAGDPVMPKLIHWVPTGKKREDALRDDERNPAYKLAAEVEKKSAEFEKKLAAHKKSLQYGPNPWQKKSKTSDAMNENLRGTFAAWMTHPSNPRFAMTIANRMWSRAMGLSLSADKHIVDNPDDASNPELIKHLAGEMVRVKFNLKEFLRIIYNTQTYQREATTTAPAMGEPYYFPGPVLRRMTAEQAWDSCMTLVLGDQIDKIKNNDAELYERSVDLDLGNPKLDAKTVILKVDAIQKLGARERGKVGGDLMMAGQTPGEADSMKVATFDGMKLMRASELEQPAPPGHFLREFGQSERMLIDGGVKSGSVPQVLMMMNGRTQKMLINRDSLINREIDGQPTIGKKVEVIFLSILNRMPTGRERGIAEKTIGDQGEREGLGAIIWALINTREFCFVQ